MSDFRIERAIISVWNKDGIEELAEILQESDVDIFSTGGTARKLQENGIEVTLISDITKYPEILNGRVKSLHPDIYGGLLADPDNKDHQADLEKVDIDPIQLVIGNLYPFSEVFEDEDKNENEILEMIDIGGPSMLRASAKNYQNVAVISDPSQYDTFINRFKNDKIDRDYRKKLAQKAFKKTLQYDQNITKYFSDLLGEDNYVGGVYNKVHDLRYGENPDQEAGFYSPDSKGEWVPFQQLAGKELSYNNYRDCRAAYEIIKDMQIEEPACALIKHMNPCGFGIGKDLKAAYSRAVATDPKSYFGGIVSVNRKVTGELAQEITESFLECVIAPGYEEEALEVFKEKEKLRLLIPDEEGLDVDKKMVKYGKGLLIQDAQKIDRKEEEDWEIVTDNKNTGDYIKSLLIGWHLVKNVKSNAIVLADDTGAVGVGAGQMSRVDALKIAIRKAEEAGLKIEDAIMASDAFFPFRDSIDLANEYGISGVIQPGGSIRDDQVVEACDEFDMFMIFTGKRVFKH